MEWRLSEAKNRFSELVSMALTEGPQRVRRRDETVVVLSLASYQQLTGERPDLKEFLLREGPHFDDLDLTRDRSPMRELDL